MTNREANLRHKLAYRKLRGEQLSEEEKQILHDLNICLKKSLPDCHEKLPLDIKNLVNQILEHPPEGPDRNKKIHFGEN